MKKLIISILLVLYLVNAIYLLFLVEALNLPTNIYNISQVIFYGLGLFFAFYNFFSVYIKKPKKNENNS